MNRQRLGVLALKGNQTGSCGLSSLGLFLIPSSSGFLTVAAQRRIHTGLSLSHYSSRLLRYLTRSRFPPDPEGGDGISNASDRLSRRKR